MNCEGAAAMAMFKLQSTGISVELSSLRFLSYGMLMLMLMYTFGFAIGSCKNSHFATENRILVSPELGTNSLDDDNNRISSNFKTYTSQYYVFVEIVISDNYLITFNNFDSIGNVLLATLSTT